MCDEAVDDSLAALKLTTDWFVTSKMIKNLYTTLHADKKMKVLVMLYFLVMKWVFFVYILIILILVIIFMKIILMLLFLSEFGLAY